MKRLVITLFALLMAVSSLTCALAATSLPEPSDDFWILDQANVLTEETEGMIFFANKLLADEEVNSEVVVVTVRTTGDYTTDDYAYALFNNWEIHGEGALLVLAIDDDDYYTIPGELLSTKLSSSDLADMQDEYLEADFAAKNYDAGVQKYFTALFDRAAKLYSSSVTAEAGKKEYEAWLTEEDAVAAPDTQTTQTQAQPAPATPQSNASRRESGGMTGIIAIIVILVVIFIIVRSRGRRNRANTYTTYNTTYYDNTPPQRSSGFNTGFLLGSLLNSRNRRPPAGPGPMPPRTGFNSAPPPRSGGYSAPSRPSSSSSRSYSSGFSSGSSRSSSGFGGATRSSSSSRSSGFSSSSSRSSSGFGGASRSHSSSFGSRGGGAGRGRR